VALAGGAAAAQAPPLSASEVLQLGKWLGPYGIEITLNSEGTDALGLTAAGKKITVRELAMDGHGNDGQRWTRFYAHLKDDGGFLFIAGSSNGLTSFRADASGNLVSAIFSGGKDGGFTLLNLANAEAEYRTVVDYWADLADQYVCPNSTTGKDPVPAEVLIASCTAIIQSPDASPRMLGYAYTNRSHGYAAKGDTVHQAEDLALAAKVQAQVR
jgi:hypothetical protein